MERGEQAIKLVNEIAGFLNLSGDKAPDLAPKKIAKSPTKKPEFASFVELATQLEDGTYELADGRVIVVADGVAEQLSEEEVAALKTAAKESTAEAEMTAKLEAMRTKLSPKKVELKKHDNVPSGGGLETFLTSQTEAMNKIVEELNLSNRSAGAPMSRGAAVENEITAQMRYDQKVMAATFNGLAKKGGNW